MAHRIETATTARSKCRGCGQTISAGDLRFGEVLPNPFADGEMTQWLHLECAAFKRPEPLLEALAAASEPVTGAESLRAEAERGLAHPRLARLSGAERSSSGRAQCRSCKEAIPKGAWRLSLVFYEDGRFSAAGFLHTRCCRAYFETTDVLARLRRFSPGLRDAELNDVQAEVDAPQPTDTGASS